MPRFYYEYCELDVEGDDAPAWIYVIFDRRQGDRELARCEHGYDAEKIVALNAIKPPSLGVFG